MPGKPQSKNLENTKQETCAKLIKELRLICTFGWGSLIVCSLVLSRFWQALFAVQWFVQSALLWSLVAYQVSKKIEGNHPTTEYTLYPVLGWANRLTILRGGLIAITGGFIFLERPADMLAWIPGAVYAIAALVDRLDGYVARMNQRETVMGAELDTEFDALGLAVAPLLAVWYGQIHWSYLLVSIAYYLFRWGIHFRQQRGLPAHELTPKPSRRAFAGFQMGFVAIALFPIFTPPFTTILGFFIMIPLLTGFVIDWLTTSGRIDEDLRKTRTFFKNLKLTLDAILLPLVRISVFAFLWLAMTPAKNSLLSGQQTDLLSSSSPYTVFILAGFVVLGLLGRFAAFVLIVILGLRVADIDMDLIYVALLFSLICIMMFGTGRYSLWQWDEHWVHRYDGT